MAGIPTATTTRRLSGSCRRATRSRPSSSSSTRRTRTATTAAQSPARCSSGLPQATLRHLGVAPTLNAPPPVLVARASDRPEIQPVHGQRDAAIVHVGTAGDTRDLPDLRGLSAREALRVLTSIGLTAHLTGVGVVASQSPAPGTPIEPWFGMCAQARTQSHGCRVAASGAMKLAAVPGIEVSGVAYDSRRVAPGDVFIALKGLKAAGTDYAAEAVSRGAVAVVADRPADVALGVPWVVVPDARAAMAAMAAELYGHPSRSMQVVGITGTNGKTTTAYLLRAVFESAGKKCGLLGTVAYSIGDREAAGVAHHAGGSGCPADVSPDGRCRLWRVRDGGLVARPRPSQSRWHECSLLACLRI